MDIKAREGQRVLAGRIGKINDKGKFYNISIATGKETWVYVNFGKEKMERSVQYLEVGQYIAIVANESQNGEYTNLHAVCLDFGPKPKPKSDEE